MALLCLLLHLTCKVPWFVIDFDWKSANELDVWMLLPTWCDGQRQPGLESCDGEKERLPYPQGHFFCLCAGWGRVPIHQIHKQMVSPSCAASERSLAKQILLCQATCGWAFLVCLVLCGEQFCKMTIDFIKENEIWGDSFHSRGVVQLIFVNERNLAKQILLCQATCGWAFLVSLVLCGD